MDELRENILEVLTLLHRDGARLSEAYIKAANRLARDEKPTIKFYEPVERSLTKALDQIISLFKDYAADIERRARDEATNKVDRLEVIDSTGRAYVKGSIYGSPVEVKLSYQDDGRTLKVFVTDRLEQLRAEGKVKS